jgi:hypothetical protein
MTFRVSDLVTNLTPGFPLEASCGAGYTAGDKVSCACPKSPSPPANPTQDYHPQGKLDLEALSFLREQLRQSLGMQVN